MSWIVVWFFIALRLLQKANALECYMCDSAENKDCAIRPGQQIDVEECSLSNDECVTVIGTNGHTRRGCLSRLFPSKYCPEPCQRCSINLCNRNIFPNDRLRCFQCLGFDCVIVANKTDLNLPCPIYHENDRCYTNIIRESNVQRGCEKTDLPNTCPNICLKCNYDGCNNEPGAYEDTCLECKHFSNSPNPQCLRDIEPVPGRHCAITESAKSSLQMNVKTCTYKQVYGHKSKCYTYVNTQTQVVERGCSKNRPFFTNGILTECYGTNCNNACLQIECSTCNASLVAENMQCRRGQNLLSENCDSETFSCYACESPNMLRRGCANSSFVSSNNEACYFCSNADGCNSKIPLRTCYHCSSRDHAFCASAVWPENSAVRKVCPSQTEFCATTIVNKLNMVFIVRGCASSVPDCSEFDPYCVYCNGSLCNNVPIELKNNWRAINLKSNKLIVKNSASNHQKVFCLILIMYFCRILS